MDIRFVCACVRPYACMQDEWTYMYHLLTFLGEPKTFINQGFHPSGLALSIRCWLQPIIKVQDIAYMDGNLYMGALICAKNRISALISTWYLIGIRVTLTNAYIGIIRNLKCKKKHVFCSFDMAEVILSAAHISAFMLWLKGARCMATKFYGSDTLHIYHSCPDDPPTWEVTTI